MRYSCEWRGASSMLHAKKSADEARSLPSLTSSLSDFDCSVQISQINHHEAKPLHLQHI